MMEHVEHQGVLQAIKCQKYRFLGGFKFTLAPLASGMTTFDLSFA